MTEPLHPWRDKIFYRQPIDDMIELGNSLCQPDGLNAGQPFVMADFQKFIAEAFGRDIDGERVVNRILITVPRKSGKALDLNTRIPTPSGWSTMGNLKVGDVVFGSDGQPTQVSYLSEINLNPESYEVSFADGEVIKACADHQWSIKDREGVFRVKTTKEMLENYFVVRPDKTPEYRYRVPICEPVELSEKVLPIDPYTLGVWLGDGKASANNLYLNKQDAPFIVSRIESSGIKIKQVREDSENCLNYKLGTKKGRNNDVRDILRKLNLLNNKHIPTEYLRASKAQRLALLQGLMDTDGHVSNQGKGHEFSTVFKNLKKGFSELLSSLGFKYSVASKHGSYDGIKCKLCYRFIFTSYKSFPAVSIPKHYNKLRSIPSKRNRFKSIVSIKRCDPVPMRCIQVNNASSTYLVGDRFTVTHNTALIAIFLIYLLVVEPIPHAQHYSIAFDRDQAAIVFNYARNIISMSEELSGVLSVTDSRKLITNVINGSTFQSLSSEGRSKHGKSSRVVIVDELHAFGPDDSLLSIMETSTGAYGNEALVIIIGTQSADDNSAMSQWVDYAEGVNNGSIKDDSFAGFVWAAPEDADIWDEKVWYACNPGMQAGFRSIDEMRKTAERAKELGGSKVSQFRNLYLNQRVDSSNPFITREAWMANDKAVDDELFKTANVYGGLDLSRRGDLTSLVLSCLDENQDLHLRIYCWTPHDLLKQHQQSDKAPYLQWADDGFLETTPGNSIGYDWVAHRLGEIAGEVNLVNINYDRYKIEELERELNRAGVALPLQPLGQGYKDFSPCMDDLEHVIAEHKLHHGNHPVLTWAISNTVVDEDPAGNRKMNKQKSFGRIDPAVALAMSIRGAMVSVEEQGISGGDEGIMFV